MNRLWVFSLLFFAGCIFSTRTPEPPTTSSSFLWTPATTPDYLLQNLTGALKALDASDYMRVFISSSDSTGSGTKTFTFNPSPDLDATSKALFNGWTVQSEGAWVTELSTLLPANTQLTILLSNENIDETSGTTASITASYAISLPTSASTGVIPGEVQGSFEMDLVYVTTQEGTKEWRIVSWNDFVPQSGAGPTWSDLKVKLSS
ncbi:MAG TPA: hypothetical protein VGM92_14775 [Candidatus Kapabacteria bacterium]